MDPKVRRRKSDDDLLVIMRAVEVTRRGPRHRGRIKNGAI